MESLRTGDAIHRLDRVAHQVDQRLFDLDHVRENRVFGGVQGHDRMSTPASVAEAPTSSQARLNEIVKALLRLVGLASGDELAKMRDDLPRPVQLRRGFVEGFVDPGPGGSVLASRRWRTVKR